MLFSVKATPILFNLSDFNAVPATNRVLQLTPMSPFVGNNIFITSDTNGQIITNLNLTTLYNATIKAPPANITFQLWIPADTTGTNNATNFTAVSGITTYPAGATAPSIQMADARYQRGTNSGGGVTVAGGVNTTVTTNGTVASVNATNQTFLTNGLYSGDAVTNAISGIGVSLTNGYQTVTNPVLFKVSSTSKVGYTNTTSNGETTFKFGGNANIDHNKFSTGDESTTIFFGTNALANFLNAEKQASGGKLKMFDNTGAGLTVSNGVLVGDASALFNLTNGLFSGNAVTNAVAGLLNAGTNGLATQPFVTNSFAGLLSVGTNGYVRSGITNGLFSGTQTTNAILGLISVATNGYVTSSVTNGLASMTASTNISISYSNGILPVITNIASQFSSTASNAINNSNGLGTNTALLGNVLIGGIANSNTSTFGSAFLASPIVGGVNNQYNWGGLANPFQGDFILGGGTNLFSASTFTLFNSGIIGGDFSSIPAPSRNIFGAIIIGGSRTTNNASYAIAMGRNVIVSNDMTFAWSDGQRANTVTNSQVIFMATNGFSINTNSAASNALRVAGNIDSSGANAGFTINGVALASTANTNSFIASTNGTANNGAQGYFSIGGGYTFLTSTNVYGSTNAGSYQGNGTWVFNGVDLTNLNAPTHIVFSSPNYNMMSNAVTLYTATSIIGTWSAVSGSAPAPTFFLGMYADDSGVVWTGSGGGFTNLLNVSWNTNTTKQFPVRSASMYWVFTNGQPIYGIINTN